MKGDERAFAELCRIFINTIYYNVSNALYDKGETEDAVQQVMISLHKGIGSLKSPYAFHSYLYQITANVCSRYNRKEARRRHCTPEDMEQEPVDEKNVTPHQAFEHKERDELLRLFIARLPEKQRYTLLLYYYYDLSYKRIAEAMDTSVTVVSSNINRAKKNMKRMIEEHEGESSDATGRKGSLKGVSLDALSSAAASSALEHAVEPGRAELLWQNCSELFSKAAAEASVVAVEAAVATKLSDAVRVLLSGVAAAGAVALVGAVLLLSAPEPQELQSKADPPPPPPLVHSSPFIPEIVSIDMVSSNPEYPETCNPARAELILSEGIPLEWCIKDEAGTVVSEGTTAVVDTAVFAAIGVGSYQMEWTVSHETGDRGVALRSFAIID
ncbi:MAG: sigma-70 family RNA polymerase sigma factor [Coriobacteriales bacterium]|jgi:RNA polymerase sigma-70 factor (ECF subfamily)|nr:sigma-70 family RNA polymerase sigma factor [Coriobacteriales bacterium]